MKRKYFLVLFASFLVSPLFAHKIALVPKEDAKVPFVEVALYEYGNSRLDQKARWVRQMQPLTRDLDQVSEDLFGLSISGGDEFCGAVSKTVREQARKKGYQFEKK